MIKNFPLATIIITIFISSLFLSSATIAPPNVYIDKEVEEKFLTEDEVSVIVILKDKSGIDVSNIKGLEKKKEAYEKRKSISKSSEAKVLNSLSSDEIILKNKYASFPGFAGKIKKNAFDKLKNNPDVKAIYIDGVSHVFLDDSGPLVNSTKTHGLTFGNYNVTGVGQSVCIIDTGVDYNHPDLGGCFGAGCKVLNGTDFVNNDQDPDDDHGHGTHVTGIVASNNTTYLGIAPNVSIISIKSCDAAGDCADSDVISGIDWCTDNKSLFNISVISMSLGANISGPTNCTAGSFEASIDSAYGLGIAVVAASGNDASSDGIASPACAGNATSVGAVYDADVGEKIWSVCTDSTTAADKVACFTNVGSLLDFYAPGSVVTSTKDGGGAEDRSGTSMATPVVAGAIALLQSYENQESTANLTVTHVINALNRTGRNVTRDSIERPRINIYEALLFLDNNSANVTIVNPTNNTGLAAGTNWTFVNITTNEIAVCYYNNTGSIFTIDVNGTELANSNATNHSFNFTNGSALSDGGNYTLYYRCTDVAGNNNSGSTYQTFNVNASFTLTLESPVDFRNSTSSNVSFNCSSVSTAYNLTNISLWGNFSTSTFEPNETRNVSSNDTWANFTLATLNDNIYTWNCQANNTGGESLFASANRTLTVDATGPADVTSVSANSKDSGWINWTWTNPTDDDYNHTEVWTDNTHRQNTTNTYYNYTGLIASTAYEIELRPVDKLGTAGNWTNLSTTTSADATNPSIVLDSPSNGSSVSTGDRTFKCTATDNYNLTNVTLYADFNGTFLNITTKDATEKTSFQLSHTESLSAGTYNWQCEANDTASNSVKSGNNTLTVTTSSETPSTGGGGGGGGGGVTPLPTESVVLGSVLAGTTATVSFANSDKHFVSQISITPKEDIKNAIVKVTKFETKPASIPKQEGKGFAYIDINPINFDSSQLEKVEVLIKVSKSWISENGFETDNIKVMKYSNKKWEKLETKKTGIEDTIIIYKAKSTDFSTFSPTGFKEIETPTGAVAALNISENITENITGVEKEKSESVITATHVVIFFAILIAITGFWVFTTWKKYFKKTEEEKESTSKKNYLNAP